MNWEEISKKYPKGYSLLRGYAKTSKPEFVCSKIIKGIRYLYDFFDEQSIFIIVDLEIQHTRTIDEDGENPHYVPEGFRFEIHDNSYCIAHSDKVYKTRTETETKGFTKGFELLEQII